MVLCVCMSIYIYVCECVCVFCIYIYIRIYSYIIYIYIHIHIYIYHYISISGIPKMEVPQNGTFLLEKPIKMNDWGTPILCSHPGVERTLGISIILMKRR